MLLAALIDIAFVLRGLMESTRHVRLVLDHAPPRLAPSGLGSLSPACASCRVALSRRLPEPRPPEHRVHVGHRRGDPAGWGLVEGGGAGGKANAEIAQSPCEAGETVDDKPISFEIDDGSPLRKPKFTLEGDMRRAFWRFEKNLSWYTAGGRRASRESHASARPASRLKVVQLAAKVGHA